MDFTTAERVAAQRVSFLGEVTVQQPGFYEAGASATGVWTSTEEARKMELAKQVDAALAAGQITPEKAPLIMSGAMTLQQAMGAAPAAAGAMVPGGAMGGAVACRGPRGKIMTAVARVLPDGTSIPESVRPGRPVVMSTDVAAAKRLKRVEKLCRKLFPKRRSKRAVFKPDGKAFA